MTRETFNKLRDDNKFGVCSYHVSHRNKTIEFSNGIQASITDLSPGELSTLISLGKSGQQDMLEYVVNVKEKLDSKPTH